MNQTTEHTRDDEQAGLTPTAGGHTAAASTSPGRRAGEAPDPAAEEAYWREHYTRRPYVPPGASFDDYGPAYRHGVDAWSRYPDRPIDELDADLDRGWSFVRGRSGLEWHQARHAVRDAWQRVNDGAEHPIAGESNPGGR